MNPFRLTVMLFALATLSTNTLAAPLDGGFTYQGELTDGGQPANGSYDIEFRLFAADSGGVQINDTESHTVNVVGGVFSVELQFDPGTIGDQALWMELRVRQSGVGGFVTLAPRQKLTSAPFALRAQGVTANSIGTDALQEESVTAADIDVTEVQRRVSGSCAAGSSIRAIFNDGTVACEADSVGAGDWTPDGGGRNFTETPIDVRHNSGILSPQLRLLEQENDYARLNFESSVNTGRFWTIAAQVAGAVESDRINFYNSAAGNGGGWDVMTIKGNRRVGVNTINPAASLHVQSLDNYASNVGNGKGDFYLGNGTTGLSIGVANAGGGAGTTRFWTNFSGDMIFGSASTDAMVVGGAGVRMVNLPDASANARPILAEPNGQLVKVAGNAGGSGPASMFGRFGGDGSDGAFPANPLVPSSDVMGGQFTTFDLAQGAILGSSGRKRIYIAVQGRCTIAGTINARGIADNGTPSSRYGIRGANTPGTAYGIAFQGLDSFELPSRDAIGGCASGSGGAGGPVIGINGPKAGANGGGAARKGGDGNVALSNGLAPGRIIDAFFGFRGYGDTLLNALQCPGGGGGLGSIIDASGEGFDYRVSYLAGSAAGGGVVYLECGELEFPASGLIDASGANAESHEPPSGGYDLYVGGNGGGGGGVVIIRARTVIQNAGQILVDGGLGAPARFGSPGWQAEAGGDGGDGMKVVVDLP